MVKVRRWAFGFLFPILLLATAPLGDSAIQNKAMGLGIKEATFVYDMPFYVGCLPPICASFRGATGICCFWAAE